MAAGLSSRLDVRGWGPRGLAASVPVEARTAGRAPLNRLCHPDSWEDPEWRIWSRALGLSQEEGYYHRKAWEWAQCIYGLERLGALGPSTRVLGVGAGHETVLYYLAGRCGLTVATDLYSGEFTATIGSEADPSFLRDPGRFAPFRYPSDRLVPLPADGCDLPFADGSFDVVYSLSSIEHFGGHAKASEAMREICRVLRPRGIACVATELILAGGDHPEYFTWDQLDAWVVKPSGLVLVEEVDKTAPPERFLDDPVRLPEEYMRTPHIVLQSDRWLFTSVMLFFVKPDARMLVRGASRRFTGALRRAPSRLTPVVARPKAV
jgi:SAM-dependent methyltransferase